ncbi:MAG: hypothetical protein ACLTH3_15385 [Lachnospira sp.]
MGFKDTEEMADAIHELKAKMGLRNDLKDLHCLLEGNRFQSWYESADIQTFTTIRLKLPMKC